VLVIENCSRPDQRIARIDLAKLAQGLGQAHGPVLVMLGEALAQRPLQAPDQVDSHAGQNRGGQDNPA
jgi:uroporphyrin-III C-methyltransferase